VLDDFDSDNRLEKEIEQNNLYIVSCELYRGREIEIETFWPLKVPRRWPRRIVLAPCRMKTFPGEVKILREFSGKLPYIPENSPGEF
jgi:hypothetical protein